LTTGRELYKTVAIHYMIFFTDYPAIAEIVLIFPIIKDIHLDEQEFNELQDFKSIQFQNCPKANFINTWHSALLLNEG
jgi:hypothetical protein